MEIKKLKLRPELIEVYEQLQRQFLSQEKVDELGLGILIGGVYEYCGDTEKTYKVVAITLNEVTGFEKSHKINPTVWERQQYGKNEGKLWFRDSDDFKSTIEIDGEQIPIMELIDDN